MENQLTIKDLSISYAKEGKVLDKLSLNVKKGEIISFFGPNGCGKTTLMNIIAGIQKPTKGLISKDEKLRFGYIFQDFRESLLPWKQVWENIAIPLFIQKKSKKEAYKKVIQLLRKTKMNLDLKAYPYMLSGGQAQMVSILRALIIHPDVLIIDEPFSALDYSNHLEMLIEIKKLQIKIGFTVLFVSHDIDDAILLGNRLVILSDKPTKITRILNIRLPAQRDVELITSKYFTEVKSNVFKSIKQPKARYNKTYTYTYQDA